MIIDEDQYLAHYGILRRSGRYPWGSGGSQTTRNRDFLDYVSNLRKQGMTEAEIARGVGISRNELQAAKSIALAQQRQEKILTANRLKEKGWSNVKIGERMGLNESSVRALLSTGAKDKADALQTTANMLKGQVDEKLMIDVGKGVEHHLGITDTRLKTAVAVLKEKGYVVENIQIKQINTGKYTTMRVLARPGTTKQEIQRNRAQIRQITEYSEDHGRSFLHTEPPIPISSRRVKVVYGDEGGSKLDGVIYVRPGAKNLSLGSDRYGQVRISIDGTHYLKGMAVINDDLPAGVDLVFHTKKSNTGRKKDAMKELEPDPDLPFGSIVRQVHDPKTGKVISAMNIVGSPTKEGSGVEGAWDTWSRNLPSQMLSKQSPELATQQLSVTYERRIRELAEINSLTNPTIRRDLLVRFADQTDSAAVHLQAAAIPRQATKVLLPAPSMKPGEVYAPTMRNGETVALVRFPHGGTFEIPQLKVNNRNREARRILGNAADAVGVHHSVAERLSGADFDGDTVLVIPHKGTIKSTAPLEGLKDFDPMVYQLPKDSPIPRITSAQKGDQMGNVSNLITDMTIQGANTEHLSRAIKHSMVVIDSEKHELDWKQSEMDHGILDLKERYQGSKRGGASTLLSRATSPKFIPENVPRSARKGGPIDPVTGKRVFEPTGRMKPVLKTRRDPITGRKIRIETGKLEPIKVRSTKLAETDDARTLIGPHDTQMEHIYAAHSNTLKALANQARKESLGIKDVPRSPSAAKVYSKEVESLTAKINLAEFNAPLERQAQLLANASLSQKRQANPNLEKSELKKIKQQDLNTARIRTGAKKTKITITDKEWEAIQAGALSTHKLKKILYNSDSDTVKRLAMPKHTPKMTSTMTRRAQSMLASGYTQIEVADALGIGLTTLKIGLGE